MTSEHIFAAAEALRQANAQTETGALSNSEDSARVAVHGFLQSAKGGEFASMKNACIVIDALIAEALKGTPGANEL